MSAANLRLDLPDMPEAAAQLRLDVRAFIDEEREAGRLPPPERVGLGFSREMTKRIAARGWIGLTWPNAASASA